MSRADLLNAFTPSESVDDPFRFSGRASEVRDLADSLQTVGSVPLIYGQRGLGKSSLALQLSRIAQGDVELLSVIDAPELALPEDQRFITFYVTCEDSTRNLKGLLKLMINAVDALKHARTADGSKGEFRLVDKKTTRALSIKMFKTETAKTYEAKVKDRDLSDLSLPEKLVTLAETLTDVYQQPVLFVIDELDRLGGIKGLSSFLKANSSAILKFALVGIGTTQGELLKDHKSLIRQLAPVQLPTMNVHELESIVAQTEVFLAEKGLPYTFTDNAKRAIARLASGFPWFVHIIGQRALIAAQEQGKHEIKSADITAAVKQLADKRMARHYYDQYMHAVRDSRPREIVLRLFAHWTAEDIPTSEIYPMAYALGINAPSNYVGHLTHSDSGAVLVRSPQQTRGLYRFQDGMFKVYVRIRSSVYSDVDDEVKRVYEAH
ncbi:P-loop NTPase fold protein [Frondihabitans sp. VKM Ac-2883]|uniref:P-loop NTPase fold protein n=1 Tax=Frondihabitans sp. VKM Ac-2883 TaxID=2783823 RepID=UPI00188D448A|nr:ATP-binding protein [Frondihabitans sp. VKM Ac-2883]